MSFAAAAIFFFIVGIYLQAPQGPAFLSRARRPAWRRWRRSPTSSGSCCASRGCRADPAPVLIADLRAELGPQWERLIADTAVAGHPVYHLKQVQESITGRVEIEHLSENSFGSLLPNHSYRKIKRLLDLALALALLPILLLPGLVVALVIRLESPGPAFFRQKRRGYRGNDFRVVKFRTMVHRARTARRAPTRTRRSPATHDSRVTRLGRFLRRTRIDELPQIWNILSGEMSWIGPRPEALPLSEWYECRAALLFLPPHRAARALPAGRRSIRAMSRSSSEVLEKLHYDFYYIKNFSAWLDLLILGTTIAIVFFGHGAK